MMHAASLNLRSMEFLRYLGVGASAALANLVSRYLLDFVMPFEAAVVLAYITGMIVGFTLFQLMLFGRQRVEPRHVRRFVLVNIFGATLAWAVSSVMARQVLPTLDWHWHRFEIAHLCGVAGPAITSYFLNKHYSFR